MSEFDDLAGIAGSAESLEPAIRWSALSQLVVRLVQIVRGLVIARLIGPTAFGVFGTALVIAGPVLLANDLGVGAFVVKEGRRARDVVASAFWLAVLAGAVASTLLVVASAPLGAVVHSSRAAPVMRGLAFAVFLNALGGVSTGLLVAELRFRSLALVQGASEAVGAIVGIVLARTGAGPWALVWAFVSSTAVIAIGGFAISGMHRIVGFQRGLTETWPRMIRFGGQLLAASFVWMVALQGDNLIVAKALGVSALGFYAFSYNYGGVPGEIGATLSRVAFPVLSRVRDSDTESEAQLSHFLRLAGPIVFASGAIAIAGTGAAVHVALGSRWTEAITPLRLFLVMGMARGVSFGQVVFRSRNRVDLELKAGLIAAPTTLVAAVVGSHFGVAGVAICVAAVMVVNEVAQSSIAFRLIGGRAGTGFRILARPAVLMALGAMPSAVALSAFEPTLLTLATWTAAGLAGEVAIVRYLMPDAWAELTRLVAPIRIRL